MNNKIKLTSFITITLLLSACQSTPTKQQVEVECQEPRPEICTRHFKPVCGVFSEGGSKTYSNDCTACADKSVKGFNLGQCAQ